MGQEKAFSIRHAERLLAIGKSSGWELKDTNKYHYSKEYGLRLKKDKGDSVEAWEKTNYSEGYQITEAPQISH